MRALKIGSKIVRSAGWLVGVVCARTAWGLWCLLRGDVAASAEEARFIGILLHDELLAALILARKLSGGVPTAVRPDRILVVKLDRIGDMVNTTPVFDALATAFPRARIDVVGHPAPLSLLEADPRIGERIAYRSSLYHPVPLLPPSWRDWRLVATLMRRRYPLVVYLRGSAPFLLLGLVSPLVATKYVRDEHVVERYLKAVRPVAPLVGRPALTLHVRPEVRQSVRERVLAPLAAGCTVAVHATAAVAMKEWPLERYVAVADALHARWGADVVFLATKSEEARVRRGLEGARFTHTVQASLTLPEVAALIAESDLFVGNDSGLSHIAAAVGTPSVLAWGSANINEARPLANASRTVILHRPLPCRSVCPEIRCINATPIACLKDITVDEAISAAARLLDRERRTERLVAWRS